MSDFLDCVSLQNCCFILWYMKKTKTKTTANSGLLFCKLSIYKLLDYKWKPLGIVYGSPLACWCLIIKTQGFSEEKNSFQTRNYSWVYSHTDQIRQSPGIVWASSSKYSADSTIGLFHCRLLTSLTHIPCFRFQLSRKMSEYAVMTLQVSLNPTLRKYFNLMNVMYLVMGYIFVPSKIHAETRLSLWQLYEKEPLLGAQASGSTLVRGSVFSLHWQVHYKAVNLLLALLLRVPPSLPFLSPSDNVRPSSYYDTARRPTPEGASWSYTFLLWVWEINFYLC